MKLKVKSNPLDFSGGPVVQILCFHRWWVQVRTLVMGAKIPHAGLFSREKKKKKKRTTFLIKKKKKKEETQLLTRPHKHFCDQHVDLTPHCLLLPLTRPLTVTLSFFLRFRH